MGKANHCLPGTGRVSEVPRQKGSRASIAPVSGLSSDVKGEICVALCLRNINATLDHKEKIRSQLGIENSRPEFNCISCNEMYLQIHSIIHLWIFHPQRSLGTQEQKTPIPFFQKYIDETERERSMRNCNIQTLMVIYFSMK